MSCDRHRKAWLEQVLLPAILSLPASRQPRFRLGAGKPQALDTPQALESYFQAASRQVDPRALGDRERAALRAEVGRAMAAMFDQAGIPRPSHVDPDLPSARRIPRPETWNGYVALHRIVTGNPELQVAVLRQAQGRASAQQLAGSRRWPDARRLGSALRRFLMEDDVFRLILTRADCGWLDGGCWTLAVALLKWLNAPGERPVAELCEIVGARRPGDPAAPQHACVRVGEWYLDGDGVSSRAALLGRWRVKERVIGPRIVAGDASRYVPDPEDAEAEMPVYLDVAAAVGRRLQRRFSRAAALEALAAADTLEH